MEITKKINDAEQLKEYAWNHYMEHKPVSVTAFQVKFGLTAEKAKELCLWVWWKTSLVWFRHRVGIEEVR